MTVLNDEHLNPGWLARVLHENSLSIRSKQTRGQAERYGCKDQFPISQQETDELAERLSERFKSWTGKTLEEHFAGRGHGA